MLKGDQLSDRPFTYYVYMKRKVIQMVEAVYLRRVFYFFLNKFIFDLSE